MDVKRHVKTIQIRHKTESRRGILIIVAQVKDAGGEWLMPTITFEGPLSPIIESSRYARDVADALTVAAHYADQFREFVKMDETRKNSLDEDF